MNTPRFLPRRAALALAGLLLVAATLRLWAIDSGAPYRMGVDEPVVLETTLRILKTGDFNPRFFDYGGLTFYVHTAVSAVAFLDGAASGRWRSLDPVWIGDLLVPTRIATALFGVLTVLVTFRIGWRFGETAAILAALAMAVLPPHVRESHFTLTDTPLTFFVALSLLLALRAAESQTRTAILLAGVGVGLAAAIKYNGAVALVMPLTAALSYPRGERLPALALLGAGAGAAFLLAAPYSLLDLPAFLNAFAALLQSYNLTRTPAEAADIYMRHLRNWYSWPGVLPLAWGLVSLGLVVAGWLRALGGTHRAPVRGAGLILLVFPVIYFAYVAYQGSLIYGRYLLPMSPMLSVGLALGTIALAERLAGWLPQVRRWALPAVVLIWLAPQAGSVATWLRDHDRRTTLDLAASWLNNRVRPGETVVMEGAPVQLPPRITLHRTGRIIDKTGPDYAASGVTYLVMSSEIGGVYEADAGNRSAELAAYRALAAAGQPMQTFAPSTTRPGPTISIVKLAR